MSGEDVTRGACCDPECERLHDYVDLGDFVWRVHDDEADIYDGPTGEFIGPGSFGSTEGSS